MQDDFSLIDDMFTIDSPLGPISTPIGELRRARRFHDVLFDPRTSLSRRSDDLRPWVIIGRRGAGKTAFLYHRCFSGTYEHKVEIESAQVFRAICRMIEKVLDHDNQGYRPFVENVSRLWKAIFVTTIASIICNTYRHDATFNKDPYLLAMADYLQRLSINRLTSPRSIMNALLKKAREFDSDSSLDVTEDLEDILINQLGVGQAASALEAFCENHRQKVIILIDSVEHFPIDDFRMDAAASGLLHLLGQLRLGYSPIHICYCIPSELQHHFAANISANPEKDFESKLMLQWSAYELLKMSALRLDKYLRTTRRLRALRDNGLPETPDREDVYRFWWRLMPKRVTNNLGKEEDSFAYIIRHTQLLPRHVIGIFNQIIRLSLSRDDDQFRITEDDIIRGVRLAANSICGGIVSSYRLVHPCSTTLCESMLPHMDNAFTMGQFRLYYRDYGRGIVNDYFEAFQMFKELGIFGIVVGESKIYYNGEFEYTQPGSMATSEDDTFCIHPAFAGEYRVGRDNNGYTSKKEVYPHGTDLDEDLAA
ncbi:MAG: hypothetical protein AAF543_01075 [Pseudomonadota bacterium]